MSLQVWLPLNGDLRNQGLSNITTTNIGATTDTNGKIGTCYYFNGTSARIACSSQTWAYPLSICGWFKPTDVTNTTTQYWISYNTATGGTAGHAIAIGTYSGKLGIWYGGTQYYNFTQTLSNNVWYHIAVTITSDKQVTTYLNGIQIDTRTFSSNNPGSSWLTLGARSNSATGGVGGASYYYKGYMNDARLYNHCLSVNEVKEISKGLLLHYSLNRNGWGQENLFLGTHMDAVDRTGWVSNSSTDWTKYFRYYNGSTSIHSFSNGEDTITLNSAANLGICFVRKATDINLDSSSYYTLSCEAKSTQTAKNMCIGLSYYNSSNTWVWRGGSNGQSFITANKWQKFTLTFKPDADTQYICYCFTVLGVSNGTDTWTVRNCKLEKGSVATPWAPNSSDAFATTIGYNTATEYDTSGYCHNGTKGGSGTISYSLDTPKYNLSTQLIGTTVDSTSNTKTGAAYITFPCSLSNITALTLSWWGKIKKYGRGGIIQTTANTSNFEEGTDYNTCPISNWDSTFRLWDGTNAFNFFSYVLKDSQWHHYVITFTSGGAKCYRDGVLVGSSGTMGNTLTNFNGLTIGLGKAGGVYRQIQEDMSDLRLYATALSAEDVADLYSQNHLS